MSTDMTKLEAALARLTPTSGTLTREELLFAAGRASAQRELGFWRGLAGLALAGAALLAVAWWTWPVRVVERVVTLEVAPSPHAVEHTSTLAPVTPSTPAPMPAPAQPPRPTPTPSQPNTPTLTWIVGPSEPAVTTGLRHWTVHDQTQLWHQQQQALRFGVESLALPQRTGSPHSGPPRTLYQLMNEAVDLLAVPADKENR